MRPDSVEPMPEKPENYSPRISHSLFGNRTLWKVVTSPRCRSKNSQNGSKPCQGNIKFSATTRIDKE
jgi:hypothetical protein